jgi:hypothetical protein
MSLFFLPFFIRRFYGILLSVSCQKEHTMPLLPEVIPERFYRGSGFQGQKTHHRPEALLK